MILKRKLFYVRVVSLIGRYLTN